MTSATSDEELVLQFQSGNNAAGDQIVKTYQSLVEIIARPYFLIGAEKEDLVQECMIGLMKAMRSYNATEDCSFKTYASVCIRNAIKDSIHKVSSAKQKTLNESLSFEALLNEHDGMLEQVTDSSFAVSVEDIVINTIRWHELIQKAAEVLSMFEYKVFRLYFEGLSYKRIAEVCGKPTKSVDTALQRIRKKLSDLAETYDNADMKGV